MYMLLKWYRETALLVNSELFQNLNFFYIWKILPSHKYIESHVKNHVLKSCYKNKLLCEIWSHVNMMHAQQLTARDDLVWNSIFLLCSKSSFPQQNAEIKILSIIVGVIQSVGVLMLCIDSIEFLTFASRMGKCCWNGKKNKLVNPFSYWRWQSFLKGL